MSAYARQEKRLIVARFALMGCLNVLQKARGLEQSYNLWNLRSERLAGRPRSSIPMVSRQVNRYEVQVGVASMKAG